MTWFLSSIGDEVPVVFEMLDCSDLLPAAVMPQSHPAVGSAGLRACPQAGAKSVRMDLFRPESKKDSEEVEPLGPLLAGVSGSKLGTKFDRRLCNIDQRHTAA